MTPGAERPAARVGVFGGTFNPIHVGHLHAAEEIAEILGLQRVWFVPSADPPHKEGSAADPLAPAGQRLAWVRAAVADNPRFGVDPLEIERGGRSFSVDTLRTLGARVAPELPVFVIGQDAFAEVGSWREPDALLTLAHFAVMTRPPSAPGAPAAWLPESLLERFELAPDAASARHREAGTWLRRVDVHAFDVSASDVRRRLREGRSVRYLLPEAVRASVIESGAFTTA